MSLMMDNFHGFGMGGGMWFLTILFWVIFIAGLFLILISLLDSRGASGKSMNNATESALQILQKRFASGEIDEATFKRMKSEIKD